MHCYVIAKHADTGWYFDGNKFTATQQQAVQLAPSVTPVDFKYNWSHHDVLIESTDREFVSRDFAF